MSRPAKKLSPYLDLLEPEEGTRGQRTYDPRQLFQYIFDNVDRNMVLLYTQNELADAIQISRESMQYFFRDMVDLGWIEKIGYRSGWRLLKTPQEIEWNKELYNKLAALRKWHQKCYRDEYKAQGITKGDILNG